MNILNIPNFKGLVLTDVHHDIDMKIEKLILNPSQVTIAFLLPNLLISDGARTRSNFVEILDSGR